MLNNKELQLANALQKEQEELKKLNLDYLTKALEWSILLLDNNKNAGATTVTHIRYLRSILFKFHFEIQEIKPCLQSLVYLCIYNNLDFYINTQETKSSDLLNSIHNTIRDLKMNDLLTI